MGKDSKRIAGPENCLSPNTFRKRITKKKLINGEKLRKDKRGAKDLKSISLQVGIVPSVTGSAYLECGKTKILCSVNGPRDVLHKSESSTKGQLYCEFKFASFSCKERQPYMPSNEEQTISKSIQDALEPVILLHKFPKSRLDILILVLENDGGVISASITCAGAALSNAGVEMYDLPVGCSLVYSDSQFLIDPTAEEELFCESEENAAKIVMAMMVEYKRQCIYMDSSGSVNHLLLAESLKVLESLCLQILTDVQTCLKQHVEEMCENDDESTEGSIAKTLEAQLKLLQPRKYMNAFLENAVRPGGRTLKEFRPVMINIESIGTANGSALVRMGETSVICGIKAELCNPSTKDPDKGFFIPNVTLTSLCSNQYIPGPPTEQAQVYSIMIKDLWENFSFIEPKDLCLFEGQLSWCLFAEMTCLSHDGNIFDACVLALMAALRCTKLPKVAINAETNSIEVEEECVDLKVGDFVFSASFAVLGTKAVADPSSEEESLADSSITIVLNSKKEVSTHLSGRIQDEQFFECIEDAKKRYVDIKCIVDGLK